MSTESPILFERENSNEPTLVTRIEDWNRLDDPKIARILETVVLSIEEFDNLLKLKFDPIEEPKEFAVFNSIGLKIEDVVSSITEVSTGKAEVADIHLYPEVVSGKDDTSLHLKAEGSRGFEAIYVFSGNATLTFPARADPIGEGVYVASKERYNIELAPGALAIIPAPTANGWISVGENFRFRYICQPPWNRNLVVPVLDQ